MIIDFSNRNHNVNILNVTVNTAQKTEEYSWKVETNIVKYRCFIYKHSNWPSVLIQRDW